MKYYTYPLNPRYSVSKSGNIIDTEDDNKKLETHFTPTNKQYVYMTDAEGVNKVVYKVYILAVTFCGARPSLNHHAKLINPHGGYIASNVEWQSEQQTNAKKVKLSILKKMLDEKNLDYLELAIKLIGENDTCQKLENLMLDIQDEIPQTAEEIIERIRKNAKENKIEKINKILKEKSSEELDQILEKLSNNIADDIKRLEDKIKKLKALKGE
jgi:signal recognition particle GTPase